MKLNELKIMYIIRKTAQGISTRKIAADLRISHERVRQINQIYKKTNKIPKLLIAGRPKKQLTESEINIVLNSFLKYKVSASILEKIIKIENNTYINHNKIHQILLENNMANNTEKKIRKKPWIRYEREHSLTAVHMDWMYDEKIGKHIIAALDDASRMILAYGEFESATAQNSIKILKEAQKYGKIKEVITDHGSQFTANKFDKKRNAYSQFAEYCKEQEIKQILCRVKHPQSNGKIERWFGLYRQKMHLFPNLKEFTYWYNHIKPHLSLNIEEIETPAKAFRRKYPQ